MSGVRTFQAEINDGVSIILSDVVLLADYQGSLMREDALIRRIETVDTELAALREELATLKSPGPLCFCGLKQTKNPHPEAGVPPGYLEVGTVYDCIPCLNKSRHGWSKKANRLQAELSAAEQRNAEYLNLLTNAFGAIDENDGWRQLCADILAVIQPTESGASE